MKPEEKNKKNYTQWYFLAIVIIGYIITSFWNLEKATSALKVFINLIEKIIPTILLVLILLTITNYFIKPKNIAKYMKNKSKWKGYLIAIITGTISSGPIYIWYPLLKNFQKQGVKNSLIVTFLYNRSIKIPLLPLIIFYFGLTYTIVLTITIMIVSIIQGLIAEKIIDWNKKILNTHTNKL